MSSLMDSTYSTSSISGFVSSKRRLVWPLNSGGKRVCTRPLYLLVLISSIMRSRRKLEVRDSGRALASVSGSTFDVFIHALILSQSGGRRGEGWRLGSFSGKALKFP